MAEGNKSNLIYFLFHRMLHNNLAHLMRSSEKLTGVRVKDVFFVQQTINLFMLYEVFSSFCCMVMICKLACAHAF